MTKLRIGALPDDRPVKRIIIFTAAQDALLRDYAAAIAAQDGLADAPPVEKLVPLIVERFIITDRGFRNHRQRVSTPNADGDRAPGKCSDRTHDSASPRKQSIDGDGRV